MPHIIVTGPESSGKTTLARQLAEHLGACYVPEYPRGYLEAVSRRAVPEDFVHFAAANRRLVAAAFEQQHRRGRPFPTVVQDTGAEVLRVWLDDKHPDENLFLEADQPRPDLTFLCRPDLPWEYDPLREDPHRRQELFRRFRALIDSRGQRCVEVSGFDESRLQGALRAVGAKFPKILPPD